MPSPQIPTSPAGDPPGLALRQAWNDRVTLAAGAAADGGAALELATYRYGPALPKPCAHPLVTPLGTVITGFEMSDHVWHRGLWFAIKFVNGTNFWEENAPPFGRQASAAEPACAFASATTLRLDHALDWTSEPTGLALRERRTLLLSPPGASGVGALDWTSELHAAQDLTFDRTPYTTWGGYGGLTFRGSRELHDLSYLLPDGETVANVIGQAHDWVVMQALVDGGPGRRVSVGIVDHPANPRTPTPWYCRSGNGYNFMNAAFLFHEPMSLPAGGTLRLRYRVLYRDGSWDPGEFAALAAAFRQSPVNPG